MQIQRHRGNSKAHTHKALTQMKMDKLNQKTQKHTYKQKQKPAKTDAYINTYIYIYIHTI